MLQSRTLPDCAVVASKPKTPALQGRRTLGLTSNHRRSVTQHSQSGYRAARSLPSAFEDDVVLPEVPVQVLDTADPSEVTGEVEVVLGNEAPSGDGVFVAVEDAPLELELQPVVDADVQPVFAEYVDEPASVTESLEPVLEASQPQVDILEVDGSVVVSQSAVEDVSSNVVQAVDVVDVPQVTELVTPLNKPLDLPFSLPTDPVGKVQSVLSDLDHTYTDFLKWELGFFQSAQKQISSAVGSVAPPELASVSMPQLPALPADVSTAVSGAFSAAKATLPLESITSFAATAQVPVDNIISSAAASALSPLAPVVGTVDNALRSFVDAEVKLVEQVVGSQRSLTSSVTNTLSNAQNNVMSTVNTALSTVEGNLNSTVSKAQDTISSAVVSPVSAATNTATVKVQTIGSAFQRALFSVEDALANAVHKVDDAVSSVTHRIEDAVHAVQYAVEDSVGLVVHTVDDTVGAVASSISSVEHSIEGAVGNVVHKVEDVTGLLQTSMLTGVGSVQGKANSTVQTVQQTVSGTVSMVEEGIDTSIQGVTGLLPPPLVEAAAVATAAAGTVLREASQDPMQAGLLGAAAVSPLVLQSALDAYFIDKLRKYTEGIVGEIGPDQVQQMLLNQDALLVDIRSLKHRYVEGLLDLRFGARFKGVVLPRSLELPRMRREGDEVEFQVMVQIIAKYITQLRQVHSPLTKLVIMDEAGGAGAKAIAYALRTEGVPLPFVMSGGFEGWRAAGFGVLVDAQKTEYDWGLVQMWGDQWEAFTNALAEKAAVLRARMAERSQGDTPSLALPTLDLPKLNFSSIEMPQMPQMSISQMQMPQMPQMPNLPSFPTAVGIAGIAAFLSNRAQVGESEEEEEDLEDKPITAEAFAVAQLQEIERQSMDEGDGEFSPAALSQRSSRASNSAIIASTYVYEEGEEEADH